MYIQAKYRKDRMKKCESLFDLKKKIDRRIDKRMAGQADRRTTDGSASDKLTDYLSGGAKNNITTVPAKWRVISAQTGLAKYVIYSQDELK